MRFWIRHGEVICPASRKRGVFDIALENGKVVAIEKPGTAPENEPFYSAKGCWVTPGWIDMHTHLREPGALHKETIRSGGEAAARGGFTSIACMANTQPVHDNPIITRYLLNEARVSSPVRVFPVGALTRGLQGECLAEMAAMKDAGIVAVSDDGKTVMNASVMARGMAHAKDLGLPVISHAEDSCLKGRGVIHEGTVSYRLGLRGIPRASEEVIVARDIALAEQTGAHLHIAHVSTLGAVRLIRDAQARGLSVTGEATPHHLHLTHEAVEQVGTFAKVAPPLREQSDVDALRKALADGVVSVLASDHAPHAASDKGYDFDRADFGMIGLEFAGALYFALVQEKVLSVEAWISAMTVGPARVLGLASLGKIEVGGLADLTVFSPKESTAVEANQLVSKSKNTPFLGLTIPGKVKATFVGGEKVYSDG